MLRANYSELSSHPRLESWPEYEADEDGSSHKPEQSDDRTSSCGAAAQEWLCWTRILPKCRSGEGLDEFLVEGFVEH
jgi:hypothetical protein